MSCDVRIMTGTMIECRLVREGSGFAHQGSILMFGGGICSGMTPCYIALRPENKRYK